MSGRGRLVALLVVVAAVLLVVLTTRATPRTPYDVESTAPDGYAALAELLERNGAAVRGAAGSDLVPATARLERADAVVAPLPSRLRDDERRALDALARAGATVVFGAPHDADDLLSVHSVDDRALADTESVPVPQGSCTVPELEGLGPIDVAFALEAPVPGGAASCYGRGGIAYVVVEAVGEGRRVTLGDPVIWSNARLQPAKETGGAPLDNAAVALRLLVPSAGSEVVVLDTAPSPGAPSTGERDPLELLPLPVKLALGQAAVALVVYLWWRGRRLGRPVGEPLPVQIAASELVEAVGDLLRRRGSAERAAATMRAELRRELAVRLGVPPGSSPDVLVARVAARTGRTDDAVRSVLLDPSPPRRPDLAALARELDSIRQEVLDDQPVR